MDCDDVPKRGIDGVVLRLVALVWKAVGKHPFGNYSGPLKQNIPGISESSRGKAQTPECDECVAPPVGEPGVTGDDRFAAAPFNQVGVRRALQR
jgi:hypothetical protein